LEALRRRELVELIVEEHSEPDCNDQQEVVTQCINGECYWNYKKRRPAEKTAEQPYRKSRHSDIESRRWWIVLVNCPDAGCYHGKDHSGNPKSAFTHRDCDES